VAAGAVDLRSLICDCKSGVSGAGKKASPTFHFPGRQDHMKAYGLTGHQHVCEVEKQLGELAGRDVRVTFTAQVVPANRGIMSVLYGTLDSGLNRSRVLDLYRDFHRNHPFVRVYDRDAAVGTMHVRGSNFCNLVVDVDERTQHLRVVSYIDNLVKGQAGNALQNANLLLGLPEDTGLRHPGMYP
jgi:N-acetyl-gamma-glutamyl-phosphate reductase